MKKEIIEIKEEVQIGDVILEAGDKIEVLKEYDRSKVRMAASEVSQIVKGFDADEFFDVMIMSYEELYNGDLEIDFPLYVQGM